ncbi:MAG: hypothetical protein D3915_02170 [Candidatus Electrothrix sp. AU1_5]|nr:hypothetical protein [Candidatus Electrothrix gigas]
MCGGSALSQSPYQNCTGTVPEGWLLQPYFHLLFPVLSPLRRNKNFNLFILFWVKNTRPSSPVLSVFS